MRKTIAIALVASFALITVSVVPFAHADKPRIKIESDEKRPSIEYAESVGIFGSIISEELEKLNARGFVPAHWKVSLSNGRGKVKIALIRIGENQPALTAVLNEDASFVEIQRVVWLVIEVVQRGGAGGAE